MTNSKNTKRALLTSVLSMMLCLAMLIGSTFAWFTDSVISGKNRIVRRIFESLGYKVVKLDRVFFAGLTKKGLRRGDWRYLTEAEVNYLRMGSFE